MNWIVILVLALALALLVAAAGWWVAWRNHDVIEDVSAEKQKIIDTLLKDHEEARKTWDVQLADRNEKLQEAKATIKARDIEMAALHGEKIDLQLEIERLQKSADHATVPLVEAVPAKRTSRKPKAQN